MLELKILYLKYYIFQKNFAKYQILIYNKEQEYTEEGEWHDFG